MMLLGVFSAAAQLLKEFSSVADGYRRAARFVG